MYFSLSPSFSPEEFDICLPCDDALWQADSARSWLEALQGPSPYGTNRARIAGVGMQHALGMLREPHIQSVMIPLNPFAQYVLIHTILRNLYSSQLDTPVTTSGSLMDNSTSSIFNSGPNDLGPAQSDYTLATQRALHNWLQIWLSSPEAIQLASDGREEPPFVYNALPFYWLAQASLMAIQNGSGMPGNGIRGGGGGTVGGKFDGDVSTEGRFRLIKEWLEHIRAFLRDGTQVPNHLWDELMQIRTRVGREDHQARASSGMGGMGHVGIGGGVGRGNGVGLGYADGLLAFFPLD